MLLALMFLIFGLAGPVDLGFGSYASLALLVLVAGFVFGGLGTGLVLMLAGVPVARIIGHRLDNPKGAMLALASAAISVWLFHAIAVQTGLTPPDEPFIMIVAACFALPAALIYRRQILLERVVERP
jgi:hypothetical protein